MGKVGQNTGFDVDVFKFYIWSPVECFVIFNADVILNGIKLFHEGDVLSLIIFYDGF